MRLEARQHRGKGVQCVAAKLVINPAPLPPVRNQAGVLEHLEVEREPRLRSRGGFREIADAALAMTEQLHDPKPSGIGERVEEAGGFFAGGGGGGSAHARNMHQVTLICQEPAQSPVSSGRKQAAGH